MKDLKQALTLRFFLFKLDLKTKELKIKLVTRVGTLYRLQLGVLMWCQGYSDWLHYEMYLYIVRTVYFILCL